MTTPVIIVGAGIAGLWTALKLAPRPVILLTGAPLGTGAATAWAQGGIAASLGEADSPSLHAKDTVEAAAELANSAAANVLARNIPAEIASLQRLGVPFDLDPRSDLALGLEAAHSCPRIVHIRGDQAGQAILDTLIKAVRSAEHVEIHDGWRATGLIPSLDSGCAGVVTRDDRNNRHDLLGDNVVLATGGYGGLFADTTSPASATGSALVMAAQIGADIRNPEFVQFHPTAIQTGSDPLPLATEALRGAGARIVDAEGQSLTGNRDLASRDVVARAVFLGQKSGRQAYLDARTAVGRDFPEAFPGVFSACMEAGIDPRTEVIPICPAAHYTMGGIVTDLHGATRVAGLWAVGECANNGLHGANRLASNSLAEGLVFGHRTALAIKDTRAHKPRAFDGTEIGSLPRLVRKGLRRAMSDLAGVERNADGLDDLLCRIDRLLCRFGPTHELVLTRIIAEASLQRTESRGAHYRSDFPDRAAHARDTVMSTIQPQTLAAE